MITVQADVRRVLATLNITKTRSNEVVRYDLDFVANPPGPIVLGHEGGKKYREANHSLHRIGG